MVKVRCQKCNREFKTYLCRVKIGAGKFCSKKCYRDENSRRLAKSGIKTRYSKGHISASKINPSIMRRGNSHPLWKGQKVGYRGIHYWVRRMLGIPKKCQKCGLKSNIPRKIDWANIDHKYRRNIEDYTPLCKSCHKITDRMNKLSTE
jgi:hypothetical protein